MASRLVKPVMRSRLAKTPPGSSRLSVSTRAPTRSRELASRLISRSASQSSSRLQSDPSAPPLSSEDLKRARRRLWGQIILIVIVGIGTILGFLFLLFPFLIETSGQINSSKYQPEKQQIKPQTPLLNAPAAYTNNENLKIIGFATPETQVQFSFNGKELAEYLIPVGINGEFSFTVKLKEGANTLSAYSLDEQGLKSNETKKYQVVLDREAPDFQLLEPQEKELVGKDKQTVTVKGKTEAQAQILLNTVQGWSDDEGLFELSYQLKEGANELLITITDRAENQGEWQLNLNFKP